jgi:flagellar biosynthesis protein FlhG
MADQADKLRELFHAAPPARQSTPAGPPLVTVTGGRTGVGATTVAVNLAAVLANRGMRTLLVDAAPQSNLARVAGVSSAAGASSLSDVLAGRCALGEAITAGPAGTMLLAKGSGERFERRCESSARRIFDRNEAPAWARQAQQRFLSELASSGNRFDVVVADIGSGMTSCSRRFWLRAQLVLLVTTAEGSALLDSYAAVKLSVADATGPDVRLLVNQCENERLAKEAHDRFADACRRFLGRSVPALPSLPKHAGVSAGELGVAPRVWETPDTPFGHALLWLGRAVSETLEESALAPLLAA